MSDGGDYGIGSYIDPRYDGPGDPRLGGDIARVGRSRSPRRRRRWGLKQRLIAFAVGTFFVGSFAYQTDPFALLFVVPFSLLVLWLLVRRAGRRK